MDVESLYTFLGPAYLKYSFTRGSEQEVAFLAERLRVAPGTAILDVGCGPGRHAAVFAERGCAVTGVDLTEAFVRLATEAARGRFVRGDARHLPFPDASFDVALSLCQGGFGLAGVDDGRVLQEMARVVKPGGRVAFTAFSAYFAVRFVEPGERFDAAAGVNHERTTVRNEQGDTREFELETSCFTPRELRLLCERAAIEVQHTWAVSPGDYAARDPDLDHPEFLVVGRRVV